MSFVNHQIERIRNADKAEKIAVKYLFYRNPIDLVIISIPIVFGYIFMNFTSLHSISSGENYAYVFSQLQTVFIANYIYGSHVAVTLSIGIFILYRWHFYRNNGSYGYWIALGINRMKFMMYATIYFLFYCTVGYILGLIMMRVYGGIYFNFGFAILLVLQLICNTILIMGAGYITTELFKNPYISVLLYSLANILLFAINNNIFRIFRTTDGIILDGFGSIISIAFGSLLGGLGMYWHSRAEIELR